jgi:hypothetical protein
MQGMQPTQEASQKDHILAIPGVEIERIRRLLNAVPFSQLDAALVGHGRERGKLQNGLLAWPHMLARQFGRDLAVLMEETGMPAQAGLWIEGLEVGIEVVDHSGQGHAGTPRR